MEEVLRAPSFLIDDGLWNKLNTELRAACHWCTHHHTTTPAEAAKQLERGEGWPRDWISRKVKNSTRQFGGLFICPAPDCSGHSNTKGERRRRWFCRFCINRHLNVDLKSFFQLDEIQGKWIQIPNLYCWHCRAKTGEAMCVNCPQKNAKRPKRARESSATTALGLPRTLLASPQLGNGMAMLGGSGDVHYDGVNGDAKQPEGVDVDESSFQAEVHPNLALSQPTPTMADLRFLAGAGPSHQRGFFPEKALLGRDALSVVPNLIEFLNNSTTPFHATLEARRHLLESGFQQLNECEEWELQPGGRYFFTRNMSSIFAFAIGRKYKPGGGFHVLAAHTDSPCPKLKPVSAATKGGFLRVRVQAYGTGLWNTWFDRDLSVAGRVLRRTKNGELIHDLVRVRRPILRIPSLAFHMDRSDSMKQDLESQLAPVLATQIEAELAVSCDSESPGEHEGNQSNDVHHPLLLQVLADELHCDVSEIADFELSIYDTQPACIGGARQEFVFSGRLDNLASAFCALWALLDTSSEPLSMLDEDYIRMVALFDNGEVGSEAVQGAGPQTMFQAMMRISRWLARGSTSEGVVERAIRRSFVVSADMAHALHPNNAENDVEHNQPKLHDGLVIKHNLTQNNATDAISAFLFKEVAKRNCIPTQNYSVVSDVGCCSTIDSVLAAGYGIRLVDCGLPQLAMHSVREMCGTEDIDAAFRHFRAFFQEIASLDDQLRVDA
ncbi:probable aspartyl aminopeptidase [Selaginella moellendorffii]|uniref:probable aspartyl aminopeptidase n=1 Tax=Selaginella moellendorffii TaxID=88036 RepID=UPI000D1C3121|nr:probable aspartyl aminopeptidase [Selaginella moellendorffii]|eukprot:XP_024527699.1 probable aspartyl aminopeptidase [Selaginella moellendorffii]